MAILALASVLAACGSDGGSGDENEQVTLRFYAGVTPTMTKEFFESAFEAFEAEHPNISVTLEDATTAAAGSTLDSLIVSHREPDLLLWGAAMTPKYVDNGLLYGFEPTDPAVADLSATERQTYNGKVYGIYFAAQPQNLLYYNKKLLAQAGIDAPATTLDDFSADLAKLKAAGITPLAGAGQPSWPATNFLWSVASTLYQTEPDWWSQLCAGTTDYTSDPIFQQSAQEWQSWYDEGYFQPGYISTNYPDDQALFGAGEAAFYSSGSWTAGAIQSQSNASDFGVTVWPTVTGEQAVSVADTALAVSAQSEHKEEAIELATFLSTGDGAAGMLKAGSFISTLESPIPWEQGTLETEVQNLMTTLPQVPSINGTMSVAPPLGDFRSAMSSDMQKMYLGELSPEEMLSNASEYATQNPAC